MARKYSSVGGYPLFYYDATGFVTCGDCADHADIPSDETLEVGANWENPQLHCDQCSTRIESAYAG
jgi:hypothetical protein